MFCYAIKRDCRGYDHLYRFESELAREHWFCPLFERSYNASFRFPVSRQYAEAFISRFLLDNPEAGFRFDWQHCWELIPSTSDKMPF